MPERDAVFFRTPAEWRAWLEAHAATGTELWVGFFKRGAGESGITWPQFARRREERSGVYSHEQAGEPVLDEAAAARLRERPGAWDFLQAQAPSYRKAALWWVVNAKRADTRARRPQQLIDDSAEGRRLGHLQSPGRRA